VIPIKPVQHLVERWKVTHEETGRVTYHYGEMPSFPYAHSVERMGFYDPNTNHCDFGTEPISEPVYGLTAAEKRRGAK